MTDGRPAGRPYDCGSASRYPNSSAASVSHSKTVSAKVRMAKISNMPKQDVLADYMVGPKAEILARLDNLVELGVRNFVLWPTGFDYDLLDWLKETVLHRYENAK